MRNYLDCSSVERLKCLSHANVASASGWNRTEKYMFATASSSIASFVETMDDAAVGFGARAVAPVACLDDVFEEVGDYLNALVDEWVNDGDFID